MDARSHSFDAESLLAEAGYLHALARELAGDAHAADDLVQDTLLTALERPPRRDEGARGLRGWLAAVLRNRARQRHRGEDRRRAREQNVARPEATEIDAGDVEARMLLLRRLADAITTLPEPQRSAVTLRWIDGCSPTQVARAQGITPDAARQRLSRAAAMLRETLDRHYHERTEWSAIVLILPGAHAPRLSITAPKGILMSTTTKVGAAALLVLLAVVLASRPWQGARPDVLVMDTNGQTSASPTTGRWTQDPQTGLAVETAPVDGARETVEPGGTQVPTSAIDRERDLHGVVLDPRGRPVAGARIEVTHRDSDGYATISVPETIPPAPAQLVASRSSADDGTFSVALPPGRPHSLRVSASGFADARFGNRFAGERVVVHMSRGSSVHGIVTRKSDGSPVEGALVHGFRKNSGHALGDPGQDSFVRTDAAGRYTLSGLTSGPCWIEVRANDALRSGAERVDLVDGAGITFDIAVDSGRTLHGRVTDARTGAPIDGALVGEWPYLFRYVRTDVEGRYEYFGFPLDEENRLGAFAGSKLGAFAEGYGKSDVVVPASAPDAKLNVDFALQPGNVVNCRIVDREGRPVEAASVAAWAYGDGRRPGDVDVRSVTSRADGKCEITSLRSDLPHVLVVRKEGFGMVLRDFPADERTRSIIELGDVVLGPMSMVSGVVVDAGGSPIPDQAVTLVGANVDRTAGREAAPLAEQLTAAPIDRLITVRDARTDDLGRFTFADVSAGDYRVRGWLEGVDDPIEVAAHVEAGARLGGLKLMLDEGLSIEGRVFGPDGNPVERAYVGTHRVRSNRIAEIHAETDAQGRFRLVGFAVGAYDLRVLTWDGRSETRFAPGEAKHVAAGTRDVVVHLRKVARIEGVVQEDDGTPVPFATVMARVGVPGATPIGERGQADGSFFIDVADGDVADLEFQRPSDRARTATSGTQEWGHLRGIAAGTKNVVLRFPPR